MIPESDFCSPGNLEETHFETEIAEGCFHIDEWIKVLLQGNLFKRGMAIDNERLTHTCGNPITCPRAQISALFNGFWQTFDQDLVEMAE